MSGLSAQVYRYMIYNIAICYVRMKDREAAIQSLRTFLSLPNLSDADRQDANRRLEELGVTAD